MAMIDVKNIGTLPASYITTLHSCTYPITPVPAQSLSLGPKDSTEIWFEVLLRPSGNEVLTCISCRALVLHRTSRMYCKRRLFPRLGLAILQIRCCK